MSMDEIGQKLKLARDNSGLSLSQIHERTKIPFNHLEAIEQGNFDDLPEPVYVAGFIKRYADCVGLDGQQAADEYRQNLENLSAKPERSGLLFKGHRNNGAAAKSIHYSRQPIEQAPPNLMKMIPFYALWVVVILALIIYLLNRQESIDLAQQDSSILALKQANMRPANAGQSGAGQTAGQSAGIKQGNEVLPDQTDNNNQGNSNNQFTVLAKKHVWVEVKAISSGEALFTGFMETGTSHNFTDQEGVHIRAGNGGNVLITAAGKTEELGLPGKIAERNFISRVSETAENKNEAEHNTEAISSNSSKPIHKTQLRHNENVGTISHAESLPATRTKKASENEATAKKALVATGTNKQAQTEEGGLTPAAPARPTAKKTVPGPSGGSENKSIEVPYRY